MPNKAQAELASFAGQQNICPWGKGAAARGRVAVHVLSSGLVGEIALRKAIRQFGSTMAGTAFVLVCSHDHAPSFDQFEEVTAAAFLALRGAVLRVYNSDRPRQERESIALQGLRDTVDRACPIRPHMLVGGLPLTVTAMGPVYQSEHPRFSPLPILCAVWTDDLRQIPEDAKEPHRERMAQLAGAPYDADDFVLPPSPADYIHRRRGPHAE